ncbi:MAG: hypothetical protein FWD94_03410 [Treponema sp.]|nr:hypothetical protein [Treponema sp.]
MSREEVAKYRFPSSDAARMAEKACDAKGEYWGTARTGWGYSDKVGITDQGTDQALHAKICEAHGGVLEE